LIKSKITQILIFFVCLSSYSQRYELKGIVQDSLLKPLEGATLLAKPSQENTSFEYAITDAKGRYSLELNKSVSYQITVSHLGFADQRLDLPINSKISTYNFTLKVTGILLDEVIVRSELKPIIIKKDTTIYNVASFANGTERKMKEILKKIPGIEVDKNGTITVQGRKVNKLLVEDKLFFGGNSKLAVDNIPADALDRIEILENYNQVSFLKNVSDNNELALNVKLKEEKKKFVFGDIEAGYGNDDFYKAHAGLFYYSPKTSASYIGDLNNAGESTFTFQDLLRFSGGISDFVERRSSLSSLNNFTRNNTDIIDSRNQFTAINTSYDISNKLSINVYGIFSKISSQNRDVSRIQYLLDNQIVEENRENNGNSRNVLGVGNIKIDYKPNKKSRWFYNNNFQSSDNRFRNDLNTLVNNNETFFNTSNETDNIKFIQYLEWHKSLSKKHILTFVANHTYENLNPENSWITDRPFLTELIPLQPSENINVSQIKRQQRNNFDILLKHYWVLNNKNHLYSHIGFNSSNESFFTEEFQQLDDDTINNFNTDDFGNNTDYKFYDIYYGIEYKFSLGDFIGRPGVFVHWYHLVNKQQDIETINIIKVLVEPQLQLEYIINKSEKFKFNYKFSNQFPRIDFLADRFTLQSFNSVFRGNGLLENERFHNATLHYNKVSLYRNLFFFTNVSFNRKVRTLRNEIVLQGINQLNTPLLTDNPETNFNVISNFKKKIYRFNLGFSSRYSFFEYLQTVNGQEEINKQNNIVFGTSVSTSDKKLPYIKIGYEKGFNNFTGSNNVRSEFEIDKFTAELDIEFLKSWVIKANFESFRNFNVNNDLSNTFNIANASLRYQKESSAWTFEISASNFLNNGIKNQNSFTDFTISEQSTFILPRIFLATLTYKL